MTSSVFILNSPFQYYLALELVKKRSFDKASLVFLYSKNESNNSIIDEVVYYLNRQKNNKIGITRLTLPVSKNGLKVSRIDILKFMFSSVICRFIKLNESYHELYLGEYRNIYISFLSNLLCARKRYVIDDGLASFSHIYSISTNLYLGLFRKCFYETNSFFINPQDYLSHLDSFKYKQLDSICFIGSNSVENQTISPQSELRMLDKIQRLNIGDEIFYRPHRFEDFNKVKQYTQRLNTPIIKSNLPFELDLLIFGNLHKTYIAYNSTVIVYLAILKNFLNLEIDIFNIVYSEDEYFQEKKFIEASDLSKHIRKYCQNHKLVINEINSK